MTTDLFFGIVVGAALGVGVYLLIGFARLRALQESFDLKLFLIKIPKEIQGEQAAQQKSPQEHEYFKIEVNKSEQLIANLAALKRPFVFEAAVAHVGEEIRFYLAVPRTMSEVAVKQIQGLWNGASIEDATDDYNIFNVHGATTAVYLKGKENYVLPIRTYQELNADPFISIIGGLAKINEIGEGAAIQVVVRPARRNIKKNEYRYIEMLKRGEPLRRVFHESPFSWEEIRHALNPKIIEEEKQDRVVDEEAVKAIESKFAKPLFLANVRVIASAGSPFQAKDILEGIAAGFSQFAAPKRNAFKVVKPRNPEKLIRQFVFRTFDPHQAVLLNSEELASVFHLPTSQTETPRVKWLKSKEAPPPTNLPTAGILIGESVYRGIVKPIYVTDEDRRRHIYCVGQTGTGKSTLLGNMIIDDIKKGRGVAIIDPHGELVENALGHVPKDRQDDVIYFDPGDLSRPLGLNMLDYNLDRPEEKTFIVNEMQSIFNKLFPPETMGPMFEQYMRNALLLLMEDMIFEPATLVEVPRVFTDADYRRRKLERIMNPVVIDFWEKEAVKAGGDASLANMTPYITSKFNNFIANDYMRPIIGQPKSAFNFREVMDHQKILLVNLAKGRIGDINAGLLGMVMTGKILMAALSRVDVEQMQRLDFNLYIDEFQNFTTDSISTILSEARKYRLNLTMAHQFIAQLTEKIRDAVFGNVGSIVVFRVGVPDTELLVKQFEPIFTANDLISIDNLNAYVRILINGETSKPFNIRIPTTSWQPGDREFAKQLKEYSRTKYGVERQAIEDDIFRRLRE